MLTLWVLKSILRFSCVRRLWRVFVVCAAPCFYDMMKHVSENQQPEWHSWHLARLVVAWLLAAVFGGLVAWFTDGSARFQWLVLAVGASALLSFALQLGTAQREGFITRTSFSVAGSVVIIAAIDIVAVLALR